MSNSLLTPQQQALFTAIQALDVKAVEALLAEGVDPNSMAEDIGAPLNQLSDMLFDWWSAILDLYENHLPVTDEMKAETLKPYLEIFEALVKAGANVHLWDSEELYGALWDASSACCLPIMQRLLDLGVSPNSRDDEGQTILSSISLMMFDNDYESVDWSDILPEEKAMFDLLIANGALTTAQLQQVNTTNIPMLM